MSKPTNLPLAAEDIVEIIEILDASPYGELELETEHFKLTVKRGTDGGWVQETQTLDEAEFINNPESVDETPAQMEPSGAVDDGLLKVTSPMVGTFYRAPKPGADPFVEVGSQVKPETIIAIIEVMKLMSTVRAGVTGEVVEVHKENGDFVEEGDLVISVRPVL